MKVQKKVLVLGGAGFIGLGIAKYIGENNNYDITIADIMSPGQRDYDFDKTVSDYSIKVIQGDYTDINCYEKLDKNYDYVYMLASVVGVNQCIEQPHEVIRINTALIQNTLKWITENNIGRVLFSSSSECYAATTDTFNYSIPTPEEVPLTVSKIGHPRYTYAVTKMLGESAFLTYGKKYKFPVTVVRYQNIFGPRMGFKHVIPHLIQRFRDDMENPFRIYGAEQTRAFCYISDASRCTVLALEDKESDQEIYHIGSSEEITIEKLTRTVGDLMGYDGKYQSAQTYPESVSRRCPDITKSLNNLGYKPNIFWKDGLQETIKWYLKFYDSKLPIYNGGFKSPKELKY